MFISISSFSQNIEKVAEIEVSYDTKVFTFKSLIDMPSNVKDSEQSTFLNAEQQKIISYFLSINGVLDASYDGATKTYTVTTKKSTTLPLNLN